jgi:hypothetical protein
LKVSDQTHSSAVLLWGELTLCTHWIRSFGGTHTRVERRGREVNLEKRREGKGREEKRGEVRRGEKRREERKGGGKGREGKRREEGRGGEGREEKGREERRGGERREGLIIEPSKHRY